MSLWSNIVEKLKGVIQKMVGVKTVEQALNISPSLSGNMENAIKLWADMYKNKAPWLHEPNWNDNRRIVSLGLPSMIAAEKARMCLLEWESEITPPTEEIDVEMPLNTPETPENSVKQPTNNTVIPMQFVKKERLLSPPERAEFLNKQYKKLKKQIRRQLEYGLAKGGFVIKPYIVFKNSVATGIEYSYVQADGFFPLTFDVSGRITEAVFVETKIEKNVVYHRLEWHRFKDNTLEIINKAYKSEIMGGNIDNDNLGRPVPLTDIPEWAELQEFTAINNIDRPLFAYFRVPEANIIDTNSPLGVSCYARAVKLIENADVQYSTLLWEYEAGQIAIDIDRDALNTVEGSDNRTHTVMNQLQNRLYRTVDLGNEETYHPFTPTLRDGSYMSGLNAILMRIEDVTGLSRGTISDASAEARTATELKILKQRSYQTNKDIQTALEDTLRDVIEIMNIYCDLYNLAPQGKYEVSFEWDDSILTDKQEELNKQMILFDRGIISDVELRMQAKGETEAQAIESLRKIAERNLQAVQNQMFEEE